MKAVLVYALSLMLALLGAASFTQAARPPAESCTMACCAEGVASSEATGCHDTSCADPCLPCLKCFSFAAVKPSGLELSMRDAVDLCFVDNDRFAPRITHGPDVPPPRA